VGDKLVTLLDGTTAKYAPSTRYSGREPGHGTGRLWESNSRAVAKSSGPALVSEQMSPSAQP